MASKLTKADLAEAKITLWEAMARGDDDSEIMDALGVEADVYGVLKRQVYDDKATELRDKPSEHVYIEYVLAQERNIADLTEMIAEFKTSKQYNAMVGAIRARADLHDKLIAKGQEFGVFRKEPERKIIAGMLVAEMTHDSLKAAITGAVGNLESMMSKYGEGTMIDVTPGDIHYGPALPPPSAALSAPVAPRVKKKKQSKTARAKTSKTSKRARGRKPFTD